MIKDKKSIMLIGMMGCGKSTVGKILAKKLNYKFVDMDEYIENIAKDSIANLFKKGEDNFRDYETKACSKIAKESNCIIAAGGGVIKRKENIEYFKDNTTIIFIDRPIENIIDDIEVSKRPLLSNGKEVLYKLKDERYELYKKYSNYTVQNVGNIEEVVNDIINIVG